MNNDELIFETLSMTRESKATYILATQSTPSLSVHLKDHIQKYICLPLGRMEKLHFITIETDLMPSPGCCIYYRFNIMGNANRTQTER